MKYRLSNVIDWSFEFEARSSDELKRKIRSGWIKYREELLKNKLLKAHNTSSLQIHFYHDKMGWVNSNNSNFPPVVKIINGNLSNVNKHPGISQINGEYTTLFYLTFLIDAHVSKLSGLSKKILHNDPKLQIAT